MSGVQRPRTDQVVPYDKLYIYEIDGRIMQRDDELVADYIGTWWEGDHSFLFFSRDHEEAIQSLLKIDPSLHLIDRFVIDYREWQGGDEITPFRVENMVFIPPWEHIIPSANEIPILLDPSVVFGNGLHPTTRGCLEAVWRVYEKDRPQTVLDLGTGTGILALACAKLGAQRVLAVDVNPLAVKVATRNVMLNAEENRVHVMEGKAENTVEERGELICCNLHYQVLDRLLSTKAFFKKRWCILSGFFESDREGVVQRLRGRGVRLEIISPRGPWQTILGFNPKTSTLLSVP